MAASTNQGDPWAHLSPMSDRQTPEERQKTPCPLAMNGLDARQAPIHLNPIAPQLPAESALEASATRALGRDIRDHRHCASHDGCIWRMLSGDCLLHIKHRFSCSSSLESLLFLVVVVLLLADMLVRRTRYSISSRRRRTQHCVSRPQHRISARHLGPGVLSNRRGAGR
ncbi:hypothetical protein IQ07DRAFT_328979 [Pyrenochaeta sp. DS3sAY3a]|nr:hypothetical protein IQ07DRAFT_328979 [Pyrenochaeta sp. DS3sAY3a]